jgi:DNA-directed RNA polymerase specialized sigma24 family protein
MIDGDDASVKDVVEATGWSESKVKVQAFRARRRMREAVEKLLSRRKHHKAKTLESAGKR